MKTLHISIIAILVIVLITVLQTASAQTAHEILQERDNTPVTQLSYNDAILIINQTTSKMEYNMGENITIHPEMINIGTAPVTVINGQPLFDIQVMNQNGTKVFDSGYSGMLIVGWGFTLNPGMTMHDNGTWSFNPYSTIPVIKLDTPGKFTVLTESNISLYNTAEESSHAIPAHPMKSLWSKPIQITILPKKSTDDELYQSNVVTVGPKTLSPTIQNMFTCYNPHMDMQPSSVYAINNQGLQFILENNPDLQNRILPLNQYEILDKFFYTVEKKLISDSQEFKSLNGNKDSIVFGSQSTVGVGGYLSCGQVGIVGSFQTDSLEKYKIIFEMKDDSTYVFVLYPYQGDPTSSKIPIKYLTITEVELSPKNGTQWVRVYNPTSYGIPLDYVNIVDSKSGLVFANSEKNSTLKPRQDIVLPVIHPTTVASDLISLNNSVTIYPVIPLMYSLPSNMPNMYWDMTPMLTDSSHDSKTWQYNGTEWAYTDKRVVIPEFPFAVPVLLISIISLLVFYRFKFRIN